MLLRGGFSQLPRVRTLGDVEYVKFGGAGVFEVRQLAKEPSQRDALIAHHFDELQTLLDQFREEKTAYLPTPYPRFAARFSDYGHLARAQEWSVGDGEDGE